MLAAPQRLSADVTTRPALEVWRGIPGLRRCLASSKGRIWDTTRDAILRPAIGRVTIAGRRYSAAELICRAFHGPPGPGELRRVDYIDGDRDDLRPSNLRWRRDPLQEPGVGWRPIPGWEGLYLVSDDGRVYSTRSARCLTGFPAAGGYRVARLVDRDRVEDRYVHRLVAAVYVANDPASLEGMEVDHIDGDPTNNNANNLDIVTHQENARRAAARGITANRIAPEDLPVISSLRQQGVSYVRIADMVGVSEVSIRQRLRPVSRDLSRN